MCPLIWLEGVVLLQERHQIGHLGHRHDVIVIDHLRVALRIDDIAKLAAPGLGTLMPVISDPMFTSATHSSGVCS